MINLTSAGVDLYKKLVDNANSLFEEDMVNDLVRGFESHKEFTYGK